MEFIYKTMKVSEASILRENRRADLARETRKGSYDKEMWDVNPTRMKGMRRTCRHKRGSTKE